MDAKLLRVGMYIKNSDGTTIIRVTEVPSLDKYEECFFSGIVVKSTNSYYKEHIGKNFRDNWNSAFHFPV